MRPKALIIIGSFSAFCSFIALGELALIFSPFILLGVLPALIFLIFTKKSKMFFAVSLAVVTGAFIGLLLKNEATKKYAPASCEQVTVASDPTGGEFLAKNNHFKGLVKTQILDLEYGDKIEACSLKQTEVKANKKKLNLIRYATSQTFYAFDVKLVSPSTSYLRGLYRFKKSSSANLMRYFSADGFALARGLLLGGSEFFSKELVDAMRNSGTSHIVAVSGYNVSIILVVIFLFLRRLVSRNISAVVTVVAIFSFAILTGLSASVVRASIMGLAYIILKLVGRPSNPFLILVGVCSLMVVFNPYVIIDLGFQLSALATLGIFLFADKFTKALEKIYLPKIISENIGATLSAQLMTMPVLAFIGKMSLIAPIPNALILPFVPLAMSLVAVTLVLSFVSHYLAFFASVFSTIILDYILFIIKIFGQSRFALRIENQYIVDLLWLGIVAVIIYLIYFRREKTKDTKHS